MASDFPSYSSGVPSYSSGVPSYSPGGPSYSPGVPSYSPTITYYSPINPSYSPPELRLRFPKERETRSLDARFDQSPTLKKILDHYVDARPSVDIVPQISTEEDSKHVDTSADKKKLWGVYSKITPSVVSVSSFFGVERKIDCSGFIIDWNPSENEATILTSAKLLWRPKDSTLEFHLIVGMVDGTLFLAKEDHVDYYHNLLTLKVKSTVELKVLDLRSRQADIIEGMNVITLGRNFDTRFLLDYSGELHVEYPYFGCDKRLRSTCSATKNCEGGPLITDAGYVIGINLNFNHPLPTAAILSCLDMWKSYGTVVRPWLGMTVVDVDQLSYRVWEQLNISPAGSYVVVKTVSKGSVADKSDVCSGDIVATCNGIPIRSAKQYYRLLSETSQAMTSGDLGEQSFTVVIKPFDRRTDNISIEADKVSVDDMRFNECWPEVIADEWNKKKGSLRNPGQRGQYYGYQPTQPTYSPT